MDQEMREAFLNLGLEEGLGATLDERDVREYIEDLPTLTPRDIKKVLEMYCSVGQD